MAVITQFPSGLPALLATLAPLVFMAFAAAAQLTTRAMGHGRSTDALGYVFVPMIAVALSVSGYLLGRALRAVVPTRPANDDRARTYRAAVLAVLAAAPLVAAIFGVSLTRAQIRARASSARPRVLLSNVAIAWQRADPATAPPPVRLGEIVWVRGTGPSTDTAAAALPRFVLTRADTAVFTQGRRVTGALDLTALDGTLMVYVLPLGSSATPHAYVALINGGGSTRRSLIAVLSPELRVLHAEIVAPWWDAQQESLCAEATVDTLAPQAAIVGGCNGHSERRRLQIRGTTDSTNL